MRIATGLAGGVAPVRAADSAAAEAAEAAPAAAAPQAALQSAVLQPAMAALRAMPEIDHDKVAALRDALAKGELPFDPAKLAGLIQRFHGSEP
ncbi:flagellar biosynthesis anti-sigma factor FlgM [Rugamonas sp. CCM 8940]|uniref:flagellar biosynthesis anti-sigma factor FlgM n=1 Tax=Rugamonas sp. CCM 8940 TaxID=2765359 RepID=UPI0018F448E8|nr:flagellar biosynthesis anti-sigma factor FlgM [Rugamonas sp. CCM 8940]MBJ7310695.1 flagellar biosynthesis anti-sigma factor FlgM [Rugamonas sp. CCM 8940]